MSAQPTVRMFLASLTGADAMALLAGFVQFGYAIRRTSHAGAAGREPCVHVVRGTPDVTKNRFLWDGVCHADIVPALRAVIAYGKGQPWFSRDGQTPRELRHANRSRVIRHAQHAGGER